eukprot:scaffold93601_cov67-Phaeocystis_antarctica.AAC.3
MAKLRGRRRAGARIRVVARFGRQNGPDDHRGAARACDRSVAHQADTDDDRQTQELRVSRAEARQGSLHSREQGERERSLGRQLCTDSQGRVGRGAHRSGEEAAEIARRVAACVTAQAGPRAGAAYRRRVGRLRLTGRAAAWSKCPGSQQPARPPSLHALAQGCPPGPERRSQAPRRPMSGCGVAACGLGPSPSPSPDPNQVREFEWDHEHTLLDGWNLAFNGSWPLQLSGKVFNNAGPGLEDGDLVEYTSQVEAARGCSPVRSRLQPCALGAAALCARGCNSTRLVEYTS